MKSDELRRRLDKNRTMVPVSIRMPEDVIEDLKRIAPQLGFSGYQPLIRAYIGQGLRSGSGATGKQSWPLAIRGKSAKPRCRYENLSNKPWPK